MLCEGSGLLPISANDERTIGECSVCGEDVDLEPIDPDLDADDSIVVASEHEEPQ